MLYYIYIIYLLIYHIYEPYYPYHFLCPKIPRDTGRPTACRLGSRIGDPDSLRPATGSSPPGERYHLTGHDGSLTGLVLCNLIDIPSGKRLHSYGKSPCYLAG